MKRKRSFFGVFLLLLLISFSPFQKGFGQESTEPEKKKAEPLSKWSKQWLEEVVPYIITGIEKNIFINLPTEVERGKFIKNFWKKRDPNPKTAENEFKREYYKRIALANKFFGDSGIDGWRTERGKIFILLGPPNEIQRDMSSSGSYFSSFHGPKEIWNYWDLPNPRLPYNLEFVFIDKLGTGNYVLERSVNLSQMGSTSFDINSLHSYFNYMEYLTEATKNPFEDLDKLQGIITTQVTYEFIPITYDSYYLKGPEERIYIPLAIEIPRSTLMQKEIENDYYFSLTLLINVSDDLGQIVFEGSKDVNFKHTSAEIDSLKDKTYQIQTSLALEPGSYKIHFLILDNFSGKIGTLHQELSVPKFNVEEFMLSDIILSSEKKTKEKTASVTEKKIFEEISHTFRSNEEMNVYFEVYNLLLNPKTGKNAFSTEYLFLHRGKPLANVPSSPGESTSEKYCRIQTSLRLKNFKPGEYVLRIKIVDSNSGQTATKETPFVVVQ